MAYNDPYAAPHQAYSNTYSNAPGPAAQYPTASGAPGQPAYPDEQEYNPYEQQPRYPTYDQQPYSDNPGGPAGYADYGRGYAGQEGGEKRYDDARVSMGPPPKDTGMLRIWRRDGRGKQWTKGGGFRSCCRFFCCFLMTLIFIVLAIILSLAAFIRPPDISFNGVSTPSNGSLLQTNGPDSFVINLDLNIGVRNPNFFDVDFNHISAKLFYPGFSPQLGSGSVSNVQFKSGTATTFLFPIALNYSTTADPSLGLLTSLGEKCGLGGAQKSDINVNFSITLALKILASQIAPTVSSSIGFACPLTQDEIDNVLGSILGNGSS
ncbi:hypothetical protein CALCODRAFT_501972 [Calocera cornea HHB12733]|uniref:Late embryogenesis abundant protein LEA-2 subgroup domain-containing protein n=1 Tax=Calocera cornea HHB12733 TaxID=1353952 RepID=A0A165DFL4_9BASI|nr:hypothetical protein CALCODRAFT_501972 [Calocera cornea HHB12733]